jgi:hypothetical protein
LDGNLFVGFNIIVDVGFGVLGGEGEGGKEKGEKEKGEKEKGEWIFHWFLI